MSIDDPIDAIIALNASDDRQRAPILGLAQDFLRIVKAFAPQQLKMPLAAVDAAVAWLNGQSAEHRDDLVDVVVEELKFRGSQIDSLIARSEEHQRFVAEEMPGLALDALRRAEQTRSRERVRRLGRIL